MAIGLRRTIADSYDKAAVDAAVAAKQNSLSANQLSVCSGELFSSAYKSEVDTNTDKISYSAAASSQVATNALKISYSAAASSQVAENAAKISYSAAASAQVAENAAKISYSAAASAQVAENAAKISYSAVASAQVAENAAKISYSAVASAQVAENTVNLAIPTFGVYVTADGSAFSVGTNCVVIVNESADVGNQLITLPTPVVGRVIRIIIANIFVLQQKAKRLRF